ncbi:MAG: hypothetical protein ACKVX7_05000 [Planctomycetota bacterium]
MRLSKNAWRDVLLLTLITALATACTPRTGGGGRGGDTTVPSTDNSFTWSKTYGGPDDDSASAMAESSRGGYLVAGNTNGFDQNASDIWAFRVDGRGQAMWSRTYGSAGIRLQELRGIAVEPSSGDIVIVGIEVVRKDVVEGVAIRLTADFQFVWRRQLEMQQPQHVLALPDSQFLVVGADLAVDGDVAVALLDADGRSLWQRTYGGGAAYTSARTDSGRYYVGGAHRVTAAPEYTRPVVYALNTDGDIQWVQDAFDPLLTQMAVRVVEVTNFAGDYIAMGTWHIPATQERTVFRQLGDAAGNLIDNNDLELSGGAFSGDIAWDWLERDQNGQYIATGVEVSDTAGVPNAAIYGRFDEDFDELNTQVLSFPAPSTNAAGTRLLRKSGGYMLVLGQISGVSGNVFIAQIGAADTIVAQIVTGAGSGTTTGNELLLAAGFALSGKLLLGGQTTTGPNGEGAWLSEFDDNYVKDRETYRSLRSRDTIVAAIENQAGDGFVCIGTTESAAFAQADKQSMYVFEVAEDDGALRWLTILRAETQFNEQGVGLCRFGDGYAVIGQSADDVLLATLDAAGALTQAIQHVAPPASDYHMVAGGIVSASNDTLYVTGTLAPDESGPGNSALLWIARLDAQLGQVWRTEFQPNFVIKGFLFTSELRGLGVAALDDGCVAVADLTSAGLDVDSVAAVRVNAAGELVWARSYFRTDDAAGIARSGAGSLTLAATTTQVGGGLTCDGDTTCPNMLAVRIDESTGQVTWARTYSTATADHAHTIGVSTSGDFFLAGDTDGVTGNRDYWAMRIASDGEISSGCPGGIGESASVHGGNLPLLINGVAASESTEPVDALFAEPNAVERFSYVQTQQCVGGGTDPAPIEFLVTISINGQGSVSASTGDTCESMCGWLVPAGTMLSLNANAAAGWTFQSWGGDYAGAPVEVTTDLEIVVNFAEPCAGGTLMYAVDDWNEGWTDVDLVSTGTSFSATQQSPTGGAPGIYRETYNAMLQFENLTVAHFTPEVLYDFSSGGAIVSLDFSAQLGLSNPLPAGDTVRFNFAVRQNGVVHVGIGSAVFTTLGWTEFAATGQSAQSFEIVGGQQVDFSASAPPIEFGYVTRAESPGGPMNHLVGVDTLRVTVHRNCP